VVVVVVLYSIGHISKHENRNMTTDFLKRIQIIPADVIMEDMRTHELAGITAATDIRKTCNEYFEKHKLLCTDGINAWNPYSNPHTSIPTRKLSNYLITHYYFVFNETDLKHRRNALLRNERLNKKKERLCACGCGKKISPEKSAKRKYYSDACKMRFMRRNKK